MATQMPMATAGDWRNFEQINLLSLESQTNIYGLAMVSLDADAKKCVLIASLDGTVTSVGYDRTQGNQLKCVCEECRVDEVIEVPSVSSCKLP